MAYSGGGGANLVCGIGLVTVTACIPVFFAAAICASWALHYRVTQMVPDIQQLLRFEVPLDDGDLRKIHRRWKLWNDAAEAFVILDGVVFIVGITLLVLGYLGWLAVLPAVVVILVLGYVLGRLRSKDRIQPTAV
jgi:hypothetical protein